MERSSEERVTRLLREWTEQDGSARERLIPLIYDELRRLAGGFMKRERSGHTLTPTALVHEAVIRLLSQTKTPASCRTELVAVVAQLMRRVLVDHVRRRHADKRGGGATLITLDEASGPGGDIAVELLDLDRALARLEALDERQAKIVEMRCFVGLTVEEVAAALNISAITVKRDWRSARAWLNRELKRN